MEVYVGELQEQWQFPSDHLPIGMTVGDVNIASWNVLDAQYMHWVTEKNSQGLSRSMIAKEHVYIKDSQLTIRDLHVVDLVLHILQHPTHPKQLLSLQECGEPFLKELKSHLSSEFVFLPYEGNAIVINRLFFEIVRVESIQGLFSEEPERSIQNVTLEYKATGQQFRFINTHLPGNPLKPARFEFAKYLVNTLDLKMTTVAMGDMNFKAYQMEEAMSSASEEALFTIYSPYCTNVSIAPEFKSKAIDHFIIHSELDQKVLAPNEVMEELAPAVDLLNREISNVGVK